MRNKLLILGLIGLTTLSWNTAFAADSDGDGVDDLVDLCPAEDASFFDADGDGCIDPTANLRHMEYWATGDLPLSYVIHENGTPNITDGSDFAAVQAGFSAWAGIAGTTLAANYLGTTPQSDASGVDGINLVTSEDPDFLAVYGSAVLAVGITTSFTVPTNFNGTDVRPGQIVDADMLFNPNRTFSTDTGGFGPDLQSTATHEAGHLFGIAHSAVVTSTMFPALPPLTAGRSLEAEDELVAFMAYPEAAALSTATEITGTVFNGADMSPIIGAAVFAVSTATGDSLGSQFTGIDGSYRFTGLPAGSYNIAVSPLDGSQSNGVVPGLISDFLGAEASSTLWLPEYWDMAESASDDGLVADAVTLGAGETVTGIDVITNVDLTAPTLVTVSPDGLSPVRADAVLFVEFDEPMDFDTATNNVVLQKVVGAVKTPIAFSLLQVSDEDVFVLDPAGLLEYSTDYELVLQAGLADRFGNVLGSDDTTAFTVEAAPPLSISSISPELLAEGTVVVLYGDGFDTGSVANNIIDFGGITATAQTAGPNSISTIVPSGLSPGSIDVSVSTTTETSNILSTTLVASFDLVRGTDITTVSLSGDVETIETLPDAVFSYVASSAGVDVVSSGASLPDFGSTTLVPVVGGVVDIAVAPDGNRVYAISRTSRKLVVINSDYGDPNARNMAFNTVIDELPVIGEPVGIAIDPSGQRAYIATAGGQIEVWDIELGSATWNRQIDLIVTPEPSLEGAIEVDRTGVRLLALTGSGDLLVYDLTDLATPPVQAAVTSDPQDIVVDPQGNVAYIVDGDGDISVWLLGSDAVSQVIPVGGSPRAMTVTPSGGLGYVADRPNDSLPGIDLTVGSASFRTVTGSLVTGDQPVDVAVSPNALYTFALEDGADELRIIGIGLGPEITNIQPRFGRPGDIVMISGSGFAQTPEPGGSFTSSSTVMFGDVEVFPLDALNDQLHVRIPAGYAGEPIRVTFEGPAFVNVPSKSYSNPLTFRVLDPLPNAPAEDADPSLFMDAHNGYLWDGLGIEATIEASPTGKFVLAVSLAQNISMIDSDPQSADFGAILATAPLSVSMKPSFLTIAPDGKVAYWAGTDEEIHILDTDPGSPTFLSEVGLIQNSLDATFSGPFPARMEIVGSGHLMVVEDELNDQIYFVDLRPESLTFRQAFQETGPLGYSTDLAIHPSGLYAYFAATDNTIHVINLDPNNAEYLTQSNLYAPQVPPMSLAFTPDGDRLVVLESSRFAGADLLVEILDTTDPSSPVPGKAPQVLATGVGTIDTEVWISPTGDRALVDVVPTALTFWLDIRETLTSSFTELTQLGLNGNAAIMDLAFTPDGSGYWAAAPGIDGITFADLVTSRKIAFVSGLNQFGVAGEALAAPLVFESDNGSGVLAAGAVAQVRIVSGGGTLGNGRDYQWVTSDSDGLFRIDWTLGPVPDADPANPQNKLTFSMNEGFSVADNIPIVSVADPNTLPMSQIQVLPLGDSVDVSTTTTMQATFSRAVDVATVTSANIYLRKQSDLSVVATAYGFADGDTRVSLSPIVELDPATIYEVVTTAGLLDTSGASLSNPQVSAFTTQAPPALAISSISPPAATVGTALVISGTAFSAVPAENTVHFAGGTSAVAVSAGPGFVTVNVPLGAVTGELTVAVGADTSPAETFTVLVPQIAPLDEIVSTVDTGVSVQSVAVLPDGSKAYTVATETGEILPVDLVTLANLPAIAVGSSPTAIVVHPNGETAYVANYGSGTVSVVDTVLDNVLTTINVGTNPVELVASPVGDRLYVVNELDQTLSVIDIDVTSATYHTVVASVPTTRSTRGAAIAPDGTKLYLGTSDGYIVVSLDPLAYGVSLSVPTTKSTKGAAITPDGTLLLLLTTTNEVLIVDVSPGGSNAVVLSVPTTKSTKGAAISPDGSLLYLLQEDTDEIFVVSLNVSSSVTATAVLSPISVSATLVKTIPVDPEPGVIAFDPSGSGLVIVAHQNTVGQLTFLNASSTPFGQVDANVEVHPQTLNLGSRGRFVTGYVSLPAGLFVENINLDSILLQGQLAPIAGKEAFVDRNQDSINELSLKFDRMAFQAILPQGDYVPVEITGTIGPEARAFAGSDTIRTIRPQILHPAGGDAFWPGQVIDITWASPEGISVASADVFWSADNGESWMPVAAGVPDTGSLTWEVPYLFTDRALVEVTIYDDQGDEIGVGLTDANFFIMDQAVPVAMQEMKLSVVDGSGILSWKVGDPQALEGFNVWRSASEDGEYTLVSEDLVRPSATAEGAEFVFKDDGIFANRDYFYRLEENRVRGEGFQHGPYRLNWKLRNELMQNFPNTFNPRTTIAFSIAEDGPVRLVVYNLAGRVVDVLVREDLKANTYKVVWEGKDRKGHGVASGVYIYQLTAPGFSAAKKMTLVR